MLGIIGHNERAVEKDLLSLPGSDAMGLPVLTLLVGAEMKSEVLENIRIAGQPDLPSDLLQDLVREYSPLNDRANYG